MLKKLSAMLAVVVLAGCSSVSTEYDYDEQVNFADYTRWAWVEASANTGAAQYQMDGLNDRRIRKALADQLSGVGLQQVAVSDAQVLVNYLTQVEKKIDVDTFYTNFGYYPYYHGRGSYWGTGVQADTRVREYKEGTLIVDIIDAKSKQLLWRGSGTDTLKKNLTPEKRTEHVNKVVMAILEGYPPGKEK
ncbi:protein of unknown function [Ferrimonas sediminum]|uniref:DUF4136 domain-containing protein n=1 Tax=Ferrimonas sediminum TaxID=718193 RepID=A0A1G8Q2S9_9GAMM|nr:DUF4136 domain-containing protein [Ferrimonas sediminum]SDI98390.1 protein of unknown function [Ferrimonas sediminum]